ncbi:Gfo/Idh/MocA family oxidoreductase [soil metagenome]
MVGVGSLGYHHARLLKGLGSFDLKGFVDTRPERATEVAAALGLTAYPDLEAMLGEVDAITVAVPTPSHFAVALAALERGRHVLLEKPITATLAEADELLDVARRKGAVLQTGHVERFNRAVRAALPHVQEPRFIESDRLAPFSIRGSDVAVVLDLMIHDIDLVLALAGEDVVALSALGVPVLTPTVDIANARLTFASGAIADITASRISRERMRKIRIFQRNGYLSLDLAAGSGEFYRLREDFDPSTLASGTAQPFDFVERVPVDAPEDDALRLELESFSAAVRGVAPPPVTGEDGRRALSVALQIVAEIERTLPSLRGRTSAP